MNAKTTAGTLRLDLPESAKWSVSITGTSGRVAEHSPRVAMPTASVGKIFLLMTLAHEAENGRTGYEQLLPLDRSLYIEDSGLLQFFNARELSVGDLAVLVGGFSDNYATNLLIQHLGIETVAQHTHAVGCSESALLDYVRDDRGPEHPPALSVGNAHELDLFMRRLGAGDLLSPGVDRKLAQWLSLNSDLSMVAGAFDLDPLAHRDADRGITLMNKTGTTNTTRADIGFVDIDGSAYSYAVLAAWEPDAPPQTRHEVMESMRQTGFSLVAWARAQHTR